MTTETKVEAVAHRIFSERTGYWGPWRNGHLPEFADPTVRIELAYPASALDALRGEVAENEGVIRVWRRRCEEAERRVAELEGAIEAALTIINKEVDPKLYPVAEQSIRSALSKVTP